MTRRDLLALTPETVTALSNRGLVKRAIRDMEAGRGPGIEELDDGTVVGHFDKGVETRIPEGTPLREATCSCGARGMCRHRVTLALAYGRSLDQRDEGAEGTAGDGSTPALVRWSPGEFDDEALLQILGKRAYARARTLSRRGYVARVRRPTAGHPIASVELSTATVRFLVPHELAYAKSDSADHSGAELLALAVWAFRVADRRDPEAAEVEVEVAPEVDRDSAGDRGLRAALTLADELLLEGVVHGRPSQAARFEQVRRGLKKAGLTWPTLCVDELEELIGAYHARSARYRAPAFADLLAELHARERASRRSGELPSRRVLGSQEQMETALDHLRLVALGARISGNEDERIAHVYLADPDTATVLVLRKTWRYGKDEAALTAPELAGKIMAARSTLRALASGNLVTASASRRANRLLTLKTSRVARTSVTPSGGDWEALPEPLRVTAVSKLDAAMAARPPRMIRPRVLAESVHALAVGKVTDVAYAPGEQQLNARVTDLEGGEMILRLPHRAAAPGALDLLARALTGEHGKPRFISGSARRSAEGLLVIPLAVAADGLHVLDLAPEGNSRTLQIHHAGTSGDPIADALERSIGLLDEGAHRGLRHVSPSYGERLLSSASRLGRLGMKTAEERLRALATTMRSAHVAGDAEPEMARRWVDARIRTRLCQEAL